MYSGVELWNQGASWEVLFRGNAWLGGTTTNRAILQAIERTQALDFGIFDFNEKFKHLHSQCRRPHLLEQSAED